MKPRLHARSSARKYGGVPEDYQDIHDFLDSAKKCLPDMRHRMILHNSFGVYLVEQLFGVVRYNSDGKEYSTRDVAEDHVIQDLGFIPTVEKCFSSMKLEMWMGGQRKLKKSIPMENLKSMRVD